MCKHRSFATGAFAENVYGSLTVAVPNDAHPSTVRSAALTFARSIWGPDAAILANMGPATGLDARGVKVSLRRFSVVIVGSFQDATVHAETTFG